MRRLMTMAGVLVLELTTMTMPATADTHRARMSDKVQVDSDLTLVTVWDRGCDSQWVRGNWVTPLYGEDGLNNSSGCGTTVQTSAGAPVTAVQACHSRTLLPMACSSWNSVY